MINALGGSIVTAVTIKLLGSIPSSAAARDAKNGNVGTGEHFAIRFLDDAGKTPSRKPSRIRNDWPYDHTDNIRDFWEPYTVNELGKNNIYVIQYCNVP